MANGNGAPQYGPGGQFHSLEPTHGVLSPLYEKEWDSMLSHIDELMADVMARGSMRQGIQDMAPEMPAEGAMALADLSAGQANINKYRGPMTEQEWNELVGRAMQYGLSHEEATSMTPEQLRATVDTGRVGRLDRRVRQINFEQPGTMAALGRAGAETLAAFGVGSAEGIVDLLQNTAFIGNTIGKMEWVNRADQYLAMMDEGVRSELFEDQVKGHQVASGVGNAVPYMAAAYGLYAALGKMGTLPLVSSSSRVISSPIVRNAIRGMGAEAILEWNRPVSWQEKAAVIVAGGVFGATLEMGGRPAALALGSIAGGAGTALGMEDPTAMHVLGGAVGGGLIAAAVGPHIAARLRRSFGTATDPYEETAQRLFTMDENGKRMLGEDVNLDYIQYNFGGGPIPSGMDVTPSTAVAVGDGPVTGPGRTGGLPPEIGPGGGPPGLPPGSPPTGPTGMGWTGGPAPRAPGVPPQRQIGPGRTWLTRDVRTGKPASIIAFRAARDPRIRSTEYAAEREVLAREFESGPEGRFMMTLELEARNPYVIDDETAPTVARWLYEDLVQEMGSPQAAHEEIGLWLGFRDVDIAGVADDADLAAEVASLLMEGGDLRGLAGQSTLNPIERLTEWVRANGTSSPKFSDINLHRTIRNRGHDLIVSRYGDTFYGGHAKKLGDELVILNPGIIKNRTGREALLPPDIAIPLSQRPDFHFSLQSANRLDPATAQQVSQVELDPSRGIIAAHGGLYNESMEAMAREFDAQPIGGPYFSVPIENARIAARQLEMLHPTVTASSGRNTVEAMQGIRGRIRQRAGTLPDEFEVVEGYSEESRRFMAKFSQPSPTDPSIGQTNVSGSYRLTDGVLELDYAEARFLATTVPGMPKLGHVVGQKGKGRYGNATVLDRLRGLVTRMEEEGLPVHEVVMVKRANRINISRERLFRDQLSAEQAAEDAIQYAKQNEINKSSVMGAKSTHPRFTDRDVVDAAIINNPGRITVMRGLDVDPKELRKLTQDRVEAGLMPHNFRYVQHPDGGMDLLIGAGKNFSNKTANEYRRFGMFSGQEVMTPRGQTVEILGFNDDAMTASVKGLYDSTDDLVREVPIEQLQATNTSRATVKAPDLYRSFRETVDTYMAEEAGKLGIPVPAYLSDETGSQLPRLMDNFLTNQGIHDPIERGAIMSYFDQRRIADYKSLATEEFEWARSVQKGVLAQLKGVPFRRQPIDEMAEDAGFIVRENDDASVTLMHKEGDLEVTLESIDEVPDFVKRFPQEAPDVTPGVPIEAMETIGSAGSSTLPAMHTRGAPSTIARMRRTETRMERAYKEMFEELGGGVGPSPALAGGGGGGAGNFPPPPGGAPLGPGGDEFFLPKPRSRLHEALKMKQGHDLQNLYVMDARVNPWFVRAFYPMRFAFIRASEVLEKAGLPINTTRIHEHYRKIVNGRDKAHNEMQPWVSEANEFLLNVRSEIRRSGKFAQVAEASGNLQRKLMDKFEFTPAEREAVGQYRDFMDRVRLAAREQGLEIGYLEDYVPHVRRRVRTVGRQGIDPYKWKGMPPDMEFFAEYARHHGIQFREMDISELTYHWLRAWKNRVHVAPHYQGMRDEWLGSQLVADVLPNTTKMISEWLDVVRYGHPQDGDMLVEGMAGFWKSLGVPMSEGDAMRALGGIQVAMYRGALGLRPDVILRDSISPAITGSRIGMAHVAGAVNRWVNGSSEEIATMLRRGVEGGWVVKGQVAVPQAELFARSTVNELGLSQLTPDQLARREQFAGVMDNFIDMLPKKYRLGIQGTGVDPLLLYTKLNEFNRLISGEAGYQRALKGWNSYVEHGNFNKLMKDSGVRVWERPIQIEAETLARQGDKEGFLKLLANEAANLQNRHGSVEIPQMWRHTFGKLATMYGTFSLQFMANVASAWRVSPQVGMATLARMGGVMGVVAGVGEVLDWDFDKWMWHKVASYSGGPALTGAVGMAGTAAAYISEAAGERPTVMEEAIRGAYQREREYRGGAAMSAFNTFFPYAGGMRTLAGYEEALTNPDRPIERALSQTFTGKTGFPGEVEEWWADYMRTHHNTAENLGGGAQQ